MPTTGFIAKYRLHHLFIWLLVFGLWYFMRYQDFSSEWLAFRVTLIKTADLALMVYTTNYLLIPVFLYKKKYGWFTLALLAMVVASSVGKMYLLSYVMNSPALRNFSGNLKGRIYDNVIPHFLLVLTGAAFKLMSDYIQMQQRMVIMAREKAEAELNFLKSQINPHFLFNTINAVYFLIDKSNAEARDALHKFSGMLRYQLYEMNGSSISIEKEMAYLKDYTDLQRLRKDAQYAVTLEYSPAVKGFSIEPLLLIPFVENAFKHVSHHKDRGNFIKLQLSMQDGMFCFNVSNSKEPAGVTANLHSGIGLNNVQRRLQLLYPGKHRLEIKDEAGEFSIALQLAVTKQK